MNNRPKVTWCFLCPFLHWQKSCVKRQTIIFKWTISLQWTNRVYSSSAEKLFRNKKWIKPLERYNYFVCVSRVEFGSWWCKAWAHDIGSTQNKFDGSFIYLLVWQDEGIWRTDTRVSGISLTKLNCKCKLYNIRSFPSSSVARENLFCRESITLLKLKLSYICVAVWGWDRRALLSVWRRAALHLL